MQGGRLFSSSFLRPKVFDHQIRFASSQTKSSNEIFSPAVQYWLNFHKIQDASVIKGTGPKGILLKGDVLGFVESGSKPQNTTSKTATQKTESKSTVKKDLGSSSGSFRDLNLDSPFLNLANSFQQAKKTIPHFYATTEVRLDDLIQLQKEINVKYPQNQVELKDFYIKAAALALRENPEANSSWKGEGVQSNRSINISSAVPTKNGILALTVSDVDGKGLSSIASEFKKLSAKADEGKLSESDLDGTFGVANEQVNQLTEILTPKQSGVISVGRGQKKVVANDTGDISVATVAEVTLSCDGRIFEEELAGKVLTSFKKYIANPHFM